MGSNTAIMVLGIFSVIAMLTFVISIGGISGEVAVKPRPGRNQCPWQYGFNFQELTKPIPPGCYQAKFSDGTLSKEWMCCNTEYWKEKHNPAVQWGKPYIEKYIRQKSGAGGKFY